MALKIEKVLVSDPLDAIAINLLKTKEVSVDINTGLNESQLIQIIPEYDALIVRSGTQVTANIIKAGKKLKVIGRAGVGVDNIDVPAATKQGIVVVNAPGGNTISAAELTCGHIIALSRHTAQSCQALKNGVWDRKSYTGSEVYGKTLAIIGLGRIGREVASRMRAFGMKTIGYDPIIKVDQAKSFGVDFYPLEKLWPQADYITLHVPLLSDTKYMLNEKTLASCKKGVRIINVARGGIIDENALLASIQASHCAGAAFDVYEEEPPKNSSLLQNPKVLCTPHLGASTKEAQVRVAEEVAQQFLDLREGKKPYGAVNPEVLK